MTDLGDASQAMNYWDAAETVIRNRDEHVHQCADVARHAIYEADLTTDLERLIMLGLDVDIRLFSNKTMLCCVAGWNFSFREEALAKAQLLIRHKANPLLTSHADKTPRQVSDDNDMRDLLEMAEREYQESHSH